MRPALGLALALLAVPLASQAPGALLREARQAYLILELDRARALATRSLARDGADTLSTADRGDALMLLGTIAVLQGRQPAADERFHDLILLNPTYTPDSLTTPSAPLQAFLRARENVKATVLEAPGPQLRVGTQRPFRARVLVSSLHDVTVVVLGADGDTVDVLWSGPIRRDQALSWTPRPGTTGPHALVSATHGGGRVVREVRVPLDLIARDRDTLPWPARPIARAEGSAPAGGSWRPLAIGAGLGAVVLLAPIVAGESAGAPARWMVAGGLTAGGLFGFLRSRRHSVDAQAVADNVSAQAAYERERQRVAAENARRRGEVTVDIRTSPPERRERGNR